MFQDLHAVRGLAQRNQDCGRPFKILLAGFIALGFALATQAEPVITSQPGYTILWDGNDGEFSGASVPDNVARASNGGQAFGSSQYSPDGGDHDIDKVINGNYGNGNGWISGSEMVPSPLDVLQTSLIS